MLRGGPSGTGQVGIEQGQVISEPSITAVAALARTFFLLWTFHLHFYASENASKFSITYILIKVALTSAFSMGNGGEG